MRNSPNTVSDMLNIRQIDSIHTSPARDTAAWGTDRLINLHIKKVPGETDLKTDTTAILITCLNAANTSTDSIVTPQCHTQNKTVTENQLLILNLKSRKFQEITEIKDRDDPRVLKLPWQRNLFRCSKAPRS